MSVQMSPNEDHEVLGSEYCSGYTDRFGKWNPGFYCPNLDATDDPVYCCGTSHYKYCCSKKDEVQHEIPNLLLVVGVAAGIFTAVVMVTALSCIFCSCCVLYKRRQTSSLNGASGGCSLPPPGPLYQMHCSSTGSGVANMYSFSNQNSSVTTPVDTGGGTHHALSDLESPYPPPAAALAAALERASPPSHLATHSFATPPLTRATTMDQCCLGVDHHEEGVGSSSPSLSLSFREHKGARMIQHRPSCSPPPSSATASPPRTSHSSSVASNLTAHSPQAQIEEALLRSTKF